MLFSTKLQKADELESIYGLKLLGNLPGKRILHIDRIKRMFNIDICCFSAQFLGLCHNVQGQCMGIVGGRTLMEVRYHGMEVREAFHGS